MVKTEERGKLLGTLMAANVGVKGIEDFVMKENCKLKGNMKDKATLKQRRELVASCMKIKIKDNWKRGVGLRKAKHKLKGTIEEKLNPKSRKCRAIMKSVKDNGMKLRERLKKKKKKKLEFLKGKYGEEQDPLDELTKKDQKKYGMARIFGDDNNIKCEDMQEPVVVCMEGEVIELSEDEKDVLSLGPKFCVLNNLNEEEIEGEVEECIIKFRWEQMKDENDEKEHVKFGEDALEAINCLFEEDELIEHEDDAMLEEARTRIVYDPDKMTLHFTKRRFTDIKGNLRVIMQEDKEF